MRLNETRETDETRGFVVRLSETNPACLTI